MVNNILIIAEGFPMYDRSSAGLRAFETAKILATRYRTTYYVLHDLMQEQILDPRETSKYRKGLQDLGVDVRNEGLEELLRDKRFDAVIVKYYYTAHRYMDIVRLMQPSATLIVDSVDVHYHRLSLKAGLTKDEKDMKTAADVKETELSVYKKADVVLAVTGEDREILLAEDPSMVVEILPNIHHVPELPDGDPKREKCLVFVGIFSHEPNVDAVLFFHNEVWPLIIRELPDLKWKIVGGQPPPGILALSSPQIEVTGYVPDTLPYLLSSAVSIAPLRFGAGMKGKVGEAMAAGLPVVTTSIGAQGMGLVHGKNILIADTPQDFARCVMHFLTDEKFNREISLSAREFIKNNYSTKAAAEKIYAVFDNLGRYSIKRWGFLSRVANKVTTDFKYQFDRHIAWRFRVTR